MDAAIGGVSRRGPDSFPKTTRQIRAVMLARVVRRSFAAESRSGAWDDQRVRAAGCTLGGAGVVTDISFPDVARVIGDSLGGGVRAILLRVSTGFPAREMTASRFTESDFVLLLSDEVQAPV